MSLTSFNAKMLGCAILFTVLYLGSRRPALQHQHHGYKKQHSPAASTHISRSECPQGRNNGIKAQSHSRGRLIASLHSEVGPFSVSEMPSETETYGAQSAWDYFQHIKHITNPFLTLFTIIVGWAMSLVDKPVSLRLPLQSHAQ